MQKLTLTAALLFSVVLFFGAAKSPTQKLSRLERDFLAQQKHLTSFTSVTGEESCGGECIMTVYRCGKDIRKIEWYAVTSFGPLQREFYFSHNKPALAMESRWTSYDTCGNALKAPRLSSIQRIWFHEKCTGPRAELQKDYREHIHALLQLSTKSR